MKIENNRIALSFFTRTNVDPHFYYFTFIRYYFSNKFQVPFDIDSKIHMKNIPFCFIFFRWQNIDEEVANYPEFHRNDFTVEFLPTLKDAKIPLAEDGFTDLSYLNADCFHWSQKLHALCEYNR